MLKIIIFFSLYLIINVQSMLLQMPLSALYGDHYPFSSTIEEDKIKIESNEYINYLYKDGTIVIEPISIKFDKTSCTLKDSNTQYYFTDKKMYYYDSTLKTYKNKEIFSHDIKFLSTTIMKYENSYYISVHTFFIDKPKIILIKNKDYLEFLSFNSIGDIVDLNKFTSYNCDGINFVDEILCLYTYDNIGKYYILSFNNNIFSISSFGNLNLSNIEGINYYNFNNTSNSKIICTVSSKNKKINCYQITRNSLSNFTIGNSLFEILSNCNNDIRDFNIANFGNEILGCCGSNNFVYCQRITSSSFSLIEEMIKIEKSGVNILPIISYFDNTFGVISFGNDNDENVYYYYIFFPKCSNFTIIIKNEYILDNNYFFNLTNRYSDDKFILKIYYISQNSNYQILFSQSGNSNSFSEMKSGNTYNYKSISSIKIKNLNVNKGDYNELISYQTITNTYSSEICEISLKLIICDDSCIDCEISYNNCTSCNNLNDYYSSPISSNQCIHLNNKKGEWFFDKQIKQYYICSIDCFQYYRINSDNLIKCDENNIYYPVQEKNNICVKKGTEYDGYFLNENNYFEKCMNNCIKCLNENTCIRCTNSFYLYNNSCYKNCPQGTRINNLNIPICISNNISFFYQNQPILLSQTLSTTLSLIQLNISNYVNISPFFSGQNFIIQIYDISYIEIMNNIAKNYNISQIEINKCKETLKSYYNLESDNDIIILKTDKLNPLSTNFVNLFLFNSKGNLLDLSICKNINITIIKKILNDSIIDWGKVFEVESIGVNIFDPNDTFFNDICFSYSNNQSNDVILSDRRNDYFQNISPCEDNCYYFTINSSSREVECFCKGNNLIQQNKNLENIENNEMNNKKEDLKNVFFKSLKHNNLKVIICYKYFFDLFKMKNLLIYWILLSCLLINIIAFFIFLNKGLTPLKKMLSLDNYSNKIKIYNRNKTIHINKIRKSNNNPPIKNNNNDNINSENDDNNNITIKYNSSKELINESKEIPFINNDLFEGNNENLIDNNFNILKNENSSIKKTAFQSIQAGTNLISQNSNVNLNSNYQDVVIYKTNIINNIFVSKIPNSKFDKKITNSLKKNNLNMNIIKNNFQKTDFIKNKKNLKKSNSMINSINTIHNLDTNKTLEMKISKKNDNKGIKRSTLLIGNKIKKKIKELEKDNFIYDKYTTHELLIMDFREAILYDNTSFCLTYWGYLKELQLFFNTFFQEIFLELKVIKIYSFILNISIILFFNAAFFYDSLVHKKYKNNIISFWSILPKSIYCSLSCFIIFSILNSLSNSTREFEIIMKTVFVRNEYIKKCGKIIKTLKIKLTFFFSLNFLLMLFFWYYSSIFCAIYSSSQKEYFKEIITSLLITLCVPFPVSLLLTFLRKISLKYKIKKLFSFVFFLKKIL